MCVFKWFVCIRVGCVCGGSLCDSNVGDVGICNGAIFSQSYRLESVKENYTGIF